MYVRSNSNVINGDMEYLKFLKSISAKVNAVQKSLKIADEFEYVLFDIYLSKYNERVKGYVKVFKNKAYVELKITQNNKTIK